MKKINVLGVLLVCILMVASCGDNDTGLVDGDISESETDVEAADGDVDAETELELDEDGDLDAEMEQEIEAELELEEEIEQELEIEDELDLDLEIEDEAEKEEDVPDPGFDQYFGSLRYTGEATGFFRTEKIDEQWWFMTPEGHPFFSTGINVLGYNGTKSIDGHYYYREAVEAKYESQEEWAVATAKRCEEWGWNTVGAWSSWRLFKDKMPYTVILYLAEANVGPIDFFADAFRAKVKQKMQSTVLPNVDDPMLIGYFMDNEMYWTDYIFPGMGVHLFDGYMAFDYDTKKGKQVLLTFLEDRYTTIAALKEDFTTDATTWEELQAVTSLGFDKDNLNAQETRKVWTGKVAEAYFKITDEEFRLVDQNHLNLGVRFVSQISPTAVLAEAGKYVDVLTINFYDMNEDWLDMFLDMGDPDLLSVENFLEDHYNEAGGNKPVMVTEWGYRVKADGYNSWPPMYPILDSQIARADAYENKFQMMLDRKYFIGQHWFLYADQPIDGRDNPNDGEDNTFGLVSEQDEPYTELTERSAMMYKKIYYRLPWPRPESK